MVRDGSECCSTPQRPAFASGGDDFPFSATSVKRNEFHFQKKNKKINAIRPTDAADENVEKMALRSVFTNFDLVSNNCTACNSVQLRATACTGHCATPVPTPFPSSFIHFGVSPLQQSPVQLVTCIVMNTTLRNIFLQFFSDICFPRKSQLS